MRTSNKILAGTFIIVLLIITGIHLALYAKYKSNDFITMKYLHEERYESYPLKEIRTVSLTGLQNVTIIPSDTARVEIEKNGERRLVHEFTNGVLIIKGDTTITNNTGTPERIRSWRSVIIYLPANQAIKSDDCELTIRGTKDSTKLFSINAEMNTTELHLGELNMSESAHGDYFSRISISKSVGGSVDISQNAVVKEMNIDIETGNFEDNNAALGVINMVADSTSTIKLSGKNIAKTKFTIK